MATSPTVYPDASVKQILEQTGRLDDQAIAAFFSVHPTLTLHQFQGALRAQSLTVLLSLLLTPDLLDHPDWSNYDDSDAIAELSQVVEHDLATLIAWLLIMNDPPDEAPTVQARATVSTTLALSAVVTVPPTSAPLPLLLVTTVSADVLSTPVEVLPLSSVFFPLASMILFPNATVPDEPTVPIDPEPTVPLDSTSTASVNLATTIARKIYPVDIPLFPALTSDYLSNLLASILSHNIRLTQFDSRDLVRGSLWLTFVISLVGRYYYRFPLTLFLTSLDAVA